MSRKPPIRIEAPEKSEGKEATFIFLHGYGDDADGWTNIAEQFHAAKKLSFMSWVFPNAKFSQEAMTNAWYTPPSFSPIPIGRSSSSSTTTSPPPEEDEDTSRDEIIESVEYITSLIASEISRGIPLDRIIVGGFSQGCAISLVLGLRYGKFRDRLGAVVGLSGYLPSINPSPNPSPDQSSVDPSVDNEGEKGKMKIFLAHGTKDMLVPMRIFRDSKRKIEEIVGEERVVTKVYEGLGHVTFGGEFMDLLGFLEGVLGGGGEEKV